MFVDISHWQPVFTPAVLRSWPIGRLVIKLGGGNGSVYESTAHRAQVAAARSAGLPADRYWFNGRASSIADQVAAIKTQLAATPLREGEELVWDIENEYDGPTLTTARWTPAEVAQAAQLLADTVPLHRQAVYASDSVTRAENWAPVAALGLIPWVASYGRNDGTVTSTPLVGYWPTADRHQYTSVGRMPAYGGDLDLNRRTPLWTVHQLQTTLNRLYNAGLAVDGDYGARTTEAVRTAQKNLGLFPDGDAGTKTLTALDGAS